MASSQCLRSEQMGVETWKLSMYLGCDELFAVCKVEWPARQPRC
jgi:hypothetical protein